MALRTFKTEAESVRFVRERLASREWWLFPAASYDATAMVQKIADHFYGGVSGEHVEFVVFLAPTPDVGILALVLVSKSGVTPAKLEEFTGAPLGDGSRDVLIHPETPVSVMVWMADRFQEDEAAVGAAT